MTATYATNFVPTQFYQREPREPAPDPVVTQHATRINTTYKEKGGAAAMVELSKVMADPALTVTQRNDLMWQVSSMTEEVATQLGRGARRTDLPESGASDASLGIDDKQEYQLTLGEFAKALQQGDPEQAQRLAGILLGATPAPPSNNQTDNLGLLGDGLRTVGSNGNVLRDAVIAQLRVEKPGNAPVGSELAQPQDVRFATVGTLVPTVSEPYNVPDGNSPEALRAYTDWAVKQAEESGKIADELAVPFNNGQDPELDPVAWEMYQTRLAAAQADRARADIALAAELRAVYAGDPKNKAATERRAREIAARYPTADQPKTSRLQKPIDNALQVVLTETPQQRNTHEKLYAVHRADDKLNSLMNDRQAGKDIPDQTIIDARDAFGGARKDLLKAVGEEIDGELPTVTTPQMLREDPLQVVIARIGRRYVDDPELQASLHAEFILRNAMVLPNVDDRMKALGRLMPNSLDPTVRAIVMSDSRGKGIVDGYVDWAADQVTGAYDAAAKTYDGYERSGDYERILFQNTPPALAATQKLLELTDVNHFGYVKPDIVARIFGKLREPGDNGKPSTMDRIIDDVALTGEWHKVLLGKDNPSGGGHGATYPTYNTVIKNLSFAMDNMGRAQDVVTGKYPPAIETEVSWLGRRFAEIVPILPSPGRLNTSPPPFMSRIDEGFKLAASEGSAILGLETARQLTRPGAPEFKDKPFDGWDRNAQANVTLTAVREGIDEFNTNSKDLFAAVNKNMAPVSSPIARFGVNMTEEQLQGAVNAVFREGPDKDLHKKMLKDREAIDLRGYQLIRLGETVTFYRQPLGHLGEYGGVVKSRDELLNSQENISMVLLSNTASLEIGAKTAMNMFRGGFREHGSLMPQTYGFIAQAADYYEYWAETYLMQKRAPGAQGDLRDPAKRTFAHEMPLPIRNDKEAMWDSGEDRKDKTANGRGGTYDRFHNIPSIQRDNYKASRLGLFPLKALGTWGGGGAAQVALWDYIHSEVGMNKGEEWRKPFLEGTVGGFAAFHLLEAGAAVARMGPTTWYEMKNLGLLDSMKQNAPLQFRKYESWVARDEALVRFSMTGTKGLTASLAGLMAIAAVWDISGVAYRMQDGYVEHQGIWGSPLWKTGTHAVNAASDLLLLRLQVREFAKRALPAAIESGFIEGGKYGPLASRAAKGLTANRALSGLGAARFMSANPIGITVNVAYMVTTGVNWLVDQNRYIADLEQYDNVFLGGAGVKEQPRELLKQHAFWTGDGKGDGFALAYQAVGGDPAKFIDYLNAQDPGKLAEAMDAMGQLPEHVQPADKQPELPVSTEFYLSLPRDGKVPENDPRFVFNERAGRYEDAYTHMYYQNGKWLYGGPKDTGSGANQLVSFDPETRKVTKSDGTRTWEEQIHVGGLKFDDPNAAYLALPDDPRKVNLENFPTITYNPGKHRYQDSATGLYFDPANQGKKLTAWRLEDDIGTMGYYYYPANQEAAYYWTGGSRGYDKHPTGIEGARAYLQAHEMMPPLA